MPKITHTGIIRGSDARTPRGAELRIKIRETKLYWISERGVKYKKPHGRGVGDWPIFYLDMSTIEPL